jgi:hypothetical protein
VTFEAVKYPVLGFRLRTLRRKAAGGCVKRRSDRRLRAAPCEHCCNYAGENGVSAKI